MNDLKMRKEEKERKVDAGTELKNRVSRNLKYNTCSSKCSIEFISGALATV